MDAPFFYFLWHDTGRIQENFTSLGSDIIYK